MSDYKVVSLFSGIGGIDLAFKNAGFEIVWSNEKDRFACTTFRSNFPDAPLSEADICSIDAESVPKADVICAGFPCQSFSIMGYQRGFNDSRGSLFFEIIRIAEAVKPKVIFLENVKNLIFHDNGKTFITIRNCLTSLGYGVKCQVQDAHTHGNIPQERSRTFVVASLDYDTINRFSFPEEIPLTQSIDNIIDRRLKHNDSYYYQSDNRYYSQLNQRMSDKTGIYRIDDSGVATRKYIISPTLKANMGTYHDRVPVIRDDFGIRKLTPYECLALQGFPKSFKFGRVPMNEAYKQVGNTVCVPVVERIAQNINKALRGDNNG